MNSLLNRQDKTGLFVNSGLAVGTAALGNAVIALFHWDRSASEPQPSFAPPGSVVGIVWLFLFAAMGAARWLTVRSGSSERKRHAGLIVLLILFCFAYPFYTAGLRQGLGLVGNLATIAFATYTAWTVRHSSPEAAVFVSPVMVWVSFATAIIIGQMQLSH